MSIFCTLNFSHKFFKIKIYIKYILLFNDKYLHNKIIYNNVLEI